MKNTSYVLKSLLTLMLLFSATLSITAQADQLSCPNYSGTWAGPCSYTGSPDSPSSISLEMKECSTVKFADTSTAFSTLSNSSFSTETSANSISSTVIWNDKSTKEFFSFVQSGLYIYYYPVSDYQYILNTYYTFKMSGNNNLSLEGKSVLQLSDGQFDTYILSCSLVRQ